MAGHEEGGNKKRRDAGAVELRLTQGVSRTTPSLLPSFTRTLNRVGVASAARTFSCDTSVHPTCSQAIRIRPRVPPSLLNAHIVDAVDYTAHSTHEKACEVKQCIHNAFPHLVSLKLLLRSHIGRKAEKFMVWSCFWGDIAYATAGCCLFCRNGCSSTQIKNIISFPTKPGIYRVCAYHQEQRYGYKNKNTHRMSRQPEIKACSVYLHVATNIVHAWIQGRAPRPRENFRRKNFDVLRAFHGFCNVQPFDHKCALSLWTYEHMQLKFLTTPFEPACAAKHHASLICEINWVHCCSI